MSTDNSKIPAPATQSTTDRQPFAGIEPVQPMQDAQQRSGMTSRSTGLMPDPSRQRQVSERPQQQQAGAPLNANQRAPSRDSALRARDRLLAKKKADEAKAQHAR